MRCIFIFDSEILSELNDPQDRRVVFIYREIIRLKKELQSFGSDLEVFHGTPLEIFKTLLHDKNIGAVFSNRDYEPYAAARDKVVAHACKIEGLEFSQFKDQVIFERGEILSAGRPYSVFTPYKNKWLATYNSGRPELFDTEKLKNNFKKFHAHEMPELNKLKFSDTGYIFTEKNWNDALFENYSSTRDIPVQDGSGLGVHLRFGTISVRQLAADSCGKGDNCFLHELIWREFFMQLLAEYPELEYHCFKKQFEGLNWRNDPEEFEAWCAGRTGYPMVDAGMRQLNATGYMHNRVRMVVASFLCKHLLIDWRWGEKYFAAKLLDYELSSNNGNWQWCAGTGADAAPYFRIFNPELQQKRFDPQFQYIKKWVSEYGTPAYPGPVVEHVFARKRCLEFYSLHLHP